MRCYCNDLCCAEDWITIHERTKDNVIQVRRITKIIKVLSISSRTLPNMQCNVIQIEEENLQLQFVIMELKSYLSYSKASNKDKLIEFVQEISDKEFQYIGTTLEYSNDIHPLPSLKKIIASNAAQKTAFPTTKTT